MPHSTSTNSARHGNDGGSPTSHRSKVGTYALRTAGVSAAGITGIVGAGAFGAVSERVVIVALIVFCVIMVGALVVAGIFITRR